MKSRLRVLILTPTALPIISGNAITAERWRKALIEKGCYADVFSTEHMDAMSLLERIEHFKPDVLHAHHVSRAGALMLDPRIEDRCQRFPLVVSPAGTDIYPREGQTHDWQSTVPRICRKACAIVAQGEWTAQKLSELFPDLKSRIMYVPKSFTWFGDRNFNLRETLGWDHNDVVFFFPAGIRPVKRNLETLTAFQEVHATRPHARLACAGPSLDPEYTAFFQEELGQCIDFARWIHLISHDAMRSAYKSADVVLNASSSEGLSNAILEAIASGRAILASDIPGNRWPVAGKTKASPCGLLFNLDNDSDFVKKAIMLIDDAMLRDRLGLAGKERAASWPGPDEEASGLIHAYEKAIERKRERVSSQ